MTRLRPQPRRLYESPGHQVLSCCLTHFDVARTFQSANMQMQTVCTQHSVRLPTPPQHLASMHGRTAPSRLPRHLRRRVP